jgi:hypothetical protein
MFNNGSFGMKISPFKPLSTGFGRSFTGGVQSRPNTPKPFNFGGFLSKKTAPVGPLTQPTGPTFAPPQGSPNPAPQAHRPMAQDDADAPGVKIARSLLATKFNRDNPTLLGAIGNVFDQGVDAWTNKHGKFKGWDKFYDED